MKVPRRCRPGRGSHRCWPAAENSNGYISAMPVPSFYGRLFMSGPTIPSRNRNGRGPTTNSSVGEARNIMQRFGFSLQVDSHPLSLLEGSGGVRREHLPGCLDEAEVTAGPCSHGCSSGVVKKLRRICVYTGQDCCKTQPFRLTRLLRNLNTAPSKLPEHKA